MWRLLPGLLLWTGCFTAEPVLGRPCPNGSCPAGLRCDPASTTCQPVPVDAPRSAADAQSDAASDASVDACMTCPALREYQITCGSQLRTAHSLCQLDGFRTAGAVRGFGWWQCGGPPTCPGGFDGLDCPSWCGGGDCAGGALCGGSHVVIERVGDGATVWDPTDVESSTCSTLNPGWRLRVECLP